MPSIPRSFRAGEPWLANSRAREVCPEVIDDAWKDELVDRLGHALKRQLAKLEKARRKHDARRATAYAANVRALAVIQRTLERLLQLDAQLAAVRCTRPQRNDDDTYAELVRRLDARLAADIANGRRPPE